MKPLQKNSPSFLPSFLPSSEDVIHIALSVYDPKGTYARHAGVVMASVLRNTDSQVCFHILHDETLTEANKQKLREIADSSPSRTSDSQHGAADFVDISAEFAKCKDIDIEQVSRRFTRGALFRLTLPDVLCSVDKILYLDCDIVVMLDVLELWKHDISRHSLGGVLAEHVMSSEVSTTTPDENARRDDIVVDKNGLDMKRYINSGVLLMNLAKIRTLRRGDSPLLQEALKYIVHYGAQMPDEEFLNAEYLADIRFLDRRFNSDPGDKIFDDIYKIGKILHFGGHTKPWNAFTGTNADMLYWIYLSYTPWCDELIESMYKAAMNEEYYHRHSKGCIKRLKLQLMSNIKNIGIRFRR